jgi:hypothetical protein
MTQSKIWNLLITMHTEAIMVTHIFRSKVQRNIKCKP